MKNSILIVILSFLSFTAFSQNIKYNEEKNQDLSNALAKVHTNNSFGFKSYLVKTFIINPDLGYSKIENPEGASQDAYISISFFEKEITTKLFKIDSLINPEVVGVDEVPEGLQITIDHGLLDDRIEETLILIIPKK
jgi:hypothetical protein